MPQHPVHPPDWIDTAPILVTKTVEIAAPPSSVWAHIADHQSWPMWFEALDKVEHLGAPTGVGGRRRVTSGRIVLDEEFTAWDEDEHFAFGVVKSGLPILGALAESVRLEPTADGTRVVYRQGVSGHPGFGWAMRLAWKRPERQLEVALANLKPLVEAEERDAEI